MLIFMNTTQTETVTGTQIAIGRRAFTVTTRTDSTGLVQYVLTGARGAVYYTVRNANRPEHMFLVDARGFGLAKGYESVWFTDVNGCLERIR